MRIFDAGRNRANLAQVRAARERPLLAQYERASRPPSARSPTPWLPAACWPKQREVGAQLSAERRRVTLAQARFDAGVASSSTCLTPSARPSPPDRRWSQTQSVQAQNLVGLWRALGGDADDGAQR